MVAGEKIHGKNWLVRRKGKNSEKRSTPARVENSIDELTRKIKEDLPANFETRIKPMMQEKNARMLKRPGEGNPDLKFNIEDFCATLPSDQDKNGTLVTQGGTGL